jgi:hypothetical protein
MWRSRPSCVHSWSALIIFKFSDSSKEVRLGSIKAFCYVSLRCHHKRKVLYTELFSFAPHHGRFFRPLSSIVISVTAVRRHDVALPSISATVFATPRPPRADLVEPRVVYTRYPDGQLTVTAPQWL